MAYQRAYFPMKDLKVSQSYGKGTSTHKNGYQIDLCGVDGGKSKVYAPFDCKVSKVYAKKDKSYEVWLTSTEKVLCKNGYYGYLTMSITHPSEIAKMKVGKKYKQGQHICYEGKEGGATGNHIHLELSTGTKAGWKVVNGDYVNVNNVKPDDYLFTREDAVVYESEYKGKKIKFVKESKMTKTVKNVPSEPLLIHKTPDYKQSSVIKKQGLYNGDDVIEFYKQGSMSYIYHYELMGYVANEYLK